MDARALLISMLIALSLSGCTAPDIAQLAKIKGTVCATVTGPGWTSTIVASDSPNSVIRGCSNVENNVSVAPPVTVQAGGQMVMQQTVQAK